MATEINLQYSNWDLYILSVVYKLVQNTVQHKTFAGVNFGGQLTICQMLQVQIVNY